MGQKRSKNQIRREKQKLRKLARPEGQNGDLNGQNPAETEELAPNVNPTVIETKSSLEKSENESKNTAEISREDKKIKKDSEAAGIIDREKSLIEKTHGPIKLGDTKDPQPDIGTESGDAKDPENENKVKNGGCLISTNQDSVGTESLKHSAEKLDTDKLPIDSTIATNPTETEESLETPGNREIAQDNKAQIMNIFLKLTDTQSAEIDEATNLDELFAQYSGVFHKFEAKPEHPLQIVAYTGNESDGTGTSASDESDYEDTGANKPVSKRQKRLREKVPVSVLKASASKPQAVEWYDADAPDPYMAVHMKTALNHVNVPSHWQQKKEYLSSKRGVERPPFVLPKFIENTGISEMRNHDPEQLKKLQRDRVQPKMGRLDIDYQKLHDAFFKHQTKPRMLAFGEVYSEGRERADKTQDDVSRMRPGKILKNLRLAVGMSESESAVPPWITVMHQLGKPPSYANLLIPGLDLEYTNLGYRVQYGGNGLALDFLGETWGSLEDGEESELELEELDPDSEEEETESFQKMGSEPLATLEPEEENAERVEIAEYSKIKATTSSNTPTLATLATLATLGTLYKILKEAPSDLLEGGEKHRYEIDEKKDSAPKKSKSVAKQVSNETEEFRF